MAFKLIDVKNDCQVAWNQIIIRLLVKQKKGFVKMKTHPSPSKEGILSRKPFPLTRSGLLLRLPAGGLIAMTMLINYQYKKDK
jgi:hypothetical protein